MATNITATTKEGGREGTGMSCGLPGLISHAEAPTAAARPSKRGTEALAGRPGRMGSVTNRGERRWAFQMGLAQPTTDNFLITSLTSRAVALVKVPIRPMPVPSLPCTSRRSGAKTVSGRTDLLDLLDLTSVISRANPPRRRTASSLRLTRD